MTRSETRPSRLVPRRHLYRPDPPVEFDYAAWLAKQRRIRMHLRALREKIRRAERQTRRLRKQLKHTHSKDAHV